MFNLLSKPLTTLMILLFLVVISTSCDNESVYLGEDTAEEITSTSPAAGIKTSCTIATGGIMSKAPDFGTCTQSLRTIVTYEPDSGTFNQVDSCIINSYGIQFDYTNPKNPSCQVFNCRLHRGPPCI